MMIMYQNDQEHNVGSEEQDYEGEFKEQTDTKPLKIFINRYSTKKYKQHHVEEIRIEFYDEDSSSSDEDGPQMLTVQLHNYQHNSMMNYKLEA